MKRIAVAIGILFITVGLCGTATQTTAAPAQTPASKVEGQPAKTNPSPTSSKADREKASYAIGMAMAKNMKSQGIDLDPDAFSKGYKDTASGAKPAMTDEEAQTRISAFQMEMIAKQQEEMEKQGAENKKKGDAFLAANKSKDGVRTTASGLQYRVIREGNGKKPGPKDTVKVNYRGKLVDGTEFDSSYKRNEPTELPVSGVIPGWTEALQLMKIGSKYEFVIPAGLAYGEAGAGGVIPPNATLVFEVELLSVETPKAAAKTGGQDPKSKQAAKKAPAAGRQQASAAETKG